jgi:hypothetical protein
MEEIWAYQFNDNVGEHMELINMIGGAQTLLYYSIRNSFGMALGVIEILINEDTNDVLVQDYGQLSNSLTENMTLGASDYFLTIFPSN